MGNNTAQVVQHRLSFLSDKCQTLSSVSVFFSCALPTSACFPYFFSFRSSSRIFGSSSKRRFCVAINKLHRDITTITTITAITTTPMSFLTDPPRLTLPAPTVLSTDLAPEQTWAEEGEGMLPRREEVVRVEEQDKGPRNVLLDEDLTARYVMFPVRDNAIWQMYKKQIASFWTVEEVQLSSDLMDWNTKLTDEERGFLSLVLAFFAASDGIVMENLATRFIDDVQLSEARAFYSFQIAMEGIHSEMYSILIDTYIRDPAEKSALFGAMERSPTIAQKADWARRWIGLDSHDATLSRATFPRRLVAFACVEGIFFSSSFAAIYWIKKRGVLSGLTFSNELISRDEALHTEFAVYLYMTYLRNSLQEQEILDMIQEAVQIETAFIEEALPKRLIGMNAGSMSQYVQFVGDRLAAQLGCTRLPYQSSNPFAFMETLGMTGKTNFFESRPTEYQSAHVFNQGDTSSELLDDDF